MNQIQTLQGPCLNFALATQNRIVRGTLNLRKSARLPLAIPAGFANAFVATLIPLALIIDRIVKPILSAMDYRQTTRKKVLNFALMPLKIIAMTPVAALSALLIPISLIATSVFIFMRRSPFLPPRQAEQRQIPIAPLTPFQEQARETQRVRAARPINWKSDFRVNVNNGFGGFGFYNFNQDGISIYLTGNQPKEEAAEVLKAISNAIHPHNRSIRVSQNNSPGIDAGGPGREFLCTLFKNLTHEAPSDRFFKKESYMFVPMFPDEDYTEENREFYENLGRVLGFSANCQIPLGEVMKRETMDVLFRMSRDPFFANHLDTYDFTQNDTLERFIPLYNAINETPYAKLLENYEDYLTAPEGLSDANLEQLYEDIQNLNGDEVNPNLTREQKIDQIRLAQVEMQSEAISQVKRQMLALLSVMKGMNGILDLSTVPSAKELGDRILGPRISPKKLARNINFQGIGFFKRHWFKSWLNKRSDTEIEQFLFLVTGSRGWQPNSRIHVSHSQYENERVHFATCSRSMSMNFDAIKKKKDMHSILSGILAMEGGFNTG